MSSSSDSVRYNKLLAVIDKALQQSRNSFDFSSAITECYGDDAKIFGAATLAKLLESLVERVNDSAKSEILDTLKKEGVEAKLLHVEQLIQTLEQEAHEFREMEKKDKSSATDALEKAKLPQGLSPEDIVKHRAFQIMKQERDGLDAELVSLQEETKRMEQQIAQAESSVQTKLAQVEDTGAKLERTADACSFVS